MIALLRGLSNSEGEGAPTQLKTPRDVNKVCLERRKEANVHIDEANVEKSHRSSRNLKINVCLLGNSHQHPINKHRF